jgi:selenide,water dikinase
MGPEALAQVLRPLAGLFDAARYPDLLRGIDPPDDAVVWRIDDEHAIVQTADFFPPVVDDPYAFGAIAAANALSDIYAMGATPLFALNLVAFPDGLDPAVLADILRGGGEKVREAGAIVAGGHTVVDREPKYGLAVTGIVHPRDVRTKGGALAGDEILLTKPIGTGVVTTAHKRGEVEEGDLAAAVASMMHLSSRAAEVLREHGAAVHALTDVTGFALAGHGHEVAHASGLALEIAWDSVPLLPGAASYAREGFVPGGTGRNEDYYERFVTFRRALAEWERKLLFDPQTSGGLLACVAAGSATAIVADLERAGEPVFRIGTVVAGEPGGIVVG